MDIARAMAVFENWKCKGSVVLWTFCLEEIVKDVRTLTGKMILGWRNRMESASVPERSRLRNELDLYLVSKKLLSCIGCLQPLSRQSFCRALSSYSCFISALACFHSSDNFAQTHLTQSRYIMLQSHLGSIVIAKQLICSLGTLGSIRILLPSSLPLLCGSFHRSLQLLVIFLLLFSVPTSSPLSSPSSTSFPSASSFTHPFSRAFCSSPTSQLQRRLVLLLNNVSQVNRFPARLEEQLKRKRPLLNPAQQGEAFVRRHQDGQVARSQQKAFTVKRAPAVVKDEPH
jgi:hypothetical protein